VTATGKIKEIYTFLNDGQQNIADYFLKTDLDGIGLPIDEIAARVGTSVASISRFCKKLGYESFGQFKIALSQDKSYEPDPVLPIFKPGDDDELIIRKAFTEALTNLQDTEKKVDFETLKKVVGLFKKYSRIYFFGLGGSGGIGKLGELLFSHLGFRAKTVTDPYEMAVTAGHASENDMIFGVSHTGRNKAVVDAVKTARERGAATAALTNYGRSPLGESAEYLLETACYEGRIHFAQSNSMAAQITVLNAMYLLAAAQAEAGVIREVNNIEDYCRRNLRLKV
jgi:DNA-binding MurR/RpiR family transcriptional regulator